MDNENKNNTQYENSYTPQYGQDAQEQAAGDDKWYAPLYGRNAVYPQYAKAASPETGKKKKVWLTVLLIVAAVALSIAGIYRMMENSSAYFYADFGNNGGGFEFGSGNGNGGGSGKTDSDDTMPEDRDDFFSNFYETTETETADVNIESTKISNPQDYAVVSADGAEMNLQEIYAACSPSVVGISGYEEGKSGYSWGTGVILSSDGLIITNTHVIEGCDTATVTLNDDTVYDALLIGADSISDIAVLKIDAKNLPAAEFGDSAALKVGDHVTAIGNPLGVNYRLTMTDGIISAIDRGVSYNGRVMTLLQTNTALNEGNSGGPLLNMYGQVIGITNMKIMSSYSSVEGIGFAIPSNTVISIANSLLKNGEVRGRTSIGITVGAIPDNASKYYDLPKGLYISDVTPGTDAEAKGIQQGDILIKVNGIEVSTTDEVAAIKNDYGVGDILVMTIWRDGEIMDIEVELMDTIDVYG